MENAGNPANAAGWGSGSDPIVMDELEAASAAPAPAPVTPWDQVKVDDPNAPEPLRGRTYGEIVSAASRAFDQAQRLEQALRTSEAARMGGGNNQSAPSAPAPEPEITDDQLNELMSTNPAAAIRASEARTEKRLRAEFNARVGPMFSDNAASARHIAQTQFPLEFQLFGDQIVEMSKSFAPEALTNPTNWGNLITYVRGQPQNIMAYAHAMGQAQGGNGSNGNPAVAARSNAVANAPFSPSSTPRSISPGSSNVGGINLADPITQEIASTLGMSMDEYTKWARMVNK